MKILTFADFHLGVKTHGKMDFNTGLNIREIQTLKVLDEMIDYAIENKIPVIIAAGDMYKNNIPSPTLQDEFNKRIKRAAFNGIKVLMLDGNHDVGKMDNSKSAMKTFETLEVDNVICTKYHKEIIETIDNQTIKFVFLPTYHTREEIEKIVENTDTKTHPTIFIGHLTVIGAMLNDWLVEQKEIYIDVNTFDKEGILAVVLGHLHKHQILHREPFVYYTGSTQRIDFNEENQPKGFVLLDIDDDYNLTHEFIEVNSQRFLTIKEDLSVMGELVESSFDGTNVIIQKLEDKKEKIKDAIIRIQIELDETTQINEKEIYKKAYDLGAFNVLTIQKTYNFERRVRNKELTEHISIERGLELHYKGKKRSEERIRIGKEIIKEVEKLNNM
ncbi:MAG: metallophosphoesterase family protein [archaeon]